MCWTEIVNFFVQGAQIIGIPIAIIVIYLNSAEARKARDLQISLQLVEVFRKKWEQKWRHLIDSKLTSEDAEEETKNILNWINWLGMLIKKGYLHDDLLVLDDLGPVLESALLECRPKIERDISETEKGENFWRGILVIAGKLEIPIESR